MRFYIFDCNGCIAGNKEGYTTMLGAKVALGKLKNRLWELFDAKTNDSTTVYEITTI